MPHFSLIPPITPICLLGFIISSQQKSLISSPSSVNIPLLPNAHQFISLYENLVLPWRYCFLFQLKPVFPLLVWWEEVTGCFPCSSLLLPGGLLADDKLQLWVWSHQTIKQPTTFSLLLSLSLISETFECLVHCDWLQRCLSYSQCFHYSWGQSPYFLGSLSFHCFSDLVLWFTSAIDSLVISSPSLWLINTSCL